MLVRLRKSGCKTQDRIPLSFIDTRSSLWLYAQKRKVVPLA